MNDKTLTYVYDATAPGLLPRRAMEVYATTDSEEQAATIAQRLIGEEGRHATTADVADLDIRSAFKYAVLAEPICDLGQCIECGRQLTTTEAICSDACPNCDRR